jgi:hypothetical protein
LSVNTAWCLSLSLADQDTIERSAVIASSWD